MNKNVSTLEDHELLRIAVKQGGNNSMCMFKYVLIGSFFFMSFSPAAAQADVSSALQRTKAVESSIFNLEKRTLFLLAENRDWNESQQRELRRREETLRERERDHRANDRFKQEQMRRQQERYQYRMEQERLRRHEKGRHWDRRKYYDHDYRRKNRPPHWRDQPYRRYDDGKYRPHELRRRGYDDGRYHPGQR